MSKPLVLISAPVETRSGYGNHSRDICTALIELDKYDVKINPVRWGSTAKTALEDSNSKHQEIKKRFLTSPSLPTQPDLHIHIVVPNEFHPIAKKNVGITAGIETTIPVPQWVEGTNRMDLNIFTSEFSRNGFTSAEFEAQDKPGHLVKMNKPAEVLFEGVDTDVYKEVNKFSKDVSDLFSKIEEDFCFLYTGHWLQGNLGEDRKDTGMLVKIFLETFKNQENQPALVLKTSGANFSVIDREEILKKIRKIKQDKNAKFPNIYLIHGDFTDSEMNELYNHPKVKTHITLTHGEGFGRPLLEAAQSGKPVVAPGWGGQVDFLHRNYSVLLPGSLTKVPKSAFPKEMFFENDENKWFTANYNVASQVMKDVVNNYSKYLVKGKQLQLYTKSEFSLEKMKEKLDKILSPLFDSIPTQVDLKLPKLQKIDNSKLNLPKLKKA